MPISGTIFLVNFLVSCRLRTRPACSVQVTLAEVFTLKRFCRPSLPPRDPPRPGERAPLCLPFCPLPGFSPALKQAQFSNLKRSLRPSPAQPPPSHSSASLSTLSPRPPSVTAPRGVPPTPRLLSAWSACSQSCYSAQTCSRLCPQHRAPATAAPGRTQRGPRPPISTRVPAPLRTPLLPRLPPPDFPSSVIASLLLKLQRHLRELPVPFLLWPLTSSPPLPPPSGPSWFLAV